MIYKSLIGLIIFSIISVNTMNVFSQAKSLPKRSDIPDKYKWNLQEIYSSNDTWNKEFAAITAELPKIAAFKGKISKNAKDLLAFMKNSVEIESRFNKLSIYASLGKDTDLNNSDFSIMYDKVLKLSSELSAAASFSNPEIMEIAPETMKNFISAEPGLIEFEFKINSILRLKPHTLSADQEKLLAQLSPIAQVASNTYNVLNDAELPFPTVKGTDGSEIKISHGRYRAALYEQDRNYRRDVYKGTYIPYNQLINTFAALYNGRVTTRITNAKIKNFNDPVAAALYSDNIPVSVYDNLLKAVNENLSTLHRWANLRKKVLKLDELHPYDTYVSLFPSVEKQYTYDESVAIILESIKPLGEEYVKAAKYGFENRWVDVYETEAKRSGAYSNSSGAGPHPFILMNWNNTMDDLFTLTHELGHNMHSYFSEKTQPFQYRDYSIFVAEVASTTNEALLLDYLIAKATTKEEKMALIEKFLVGCQATFFRQTRFAEFEREVHTRALAGEFMTADQLTKLFADMYQKYWGPTMVTDYEEGLSWARIPHLMKYNFYVYQYSTGFAAAQALSEAIQKEGKPAIDKYLNFLSAGSSDYPIEVLKKAGVDMSKKDPILATIQKMNKYLDELEKMLK